MSNKKNALVAGGSGFVGSHLCELLLRNGYSVTALDSFTTGREKNVHSALKMGLRLIQHDIRTPWKPDQHFHEIYNLASPASPIDFETMPNFILETASMGHKNMLELGRQMKARVLYCSSSEVYGDPHVHPQNESYFGNVNPIGPRSCYDEAKRYGEAVSTAYATEHGVEVRIARIFNTYGPRMRPNDGRIIPAFMSQALSNQDITVHGDGLQTRSFCYVEDLAQGLYALMLGSDNKPTNIGNVDEHSVVAMAHMIIKMAGSTSKVIHLEARHEDPKKRRPDVTKAERVLNWKAKVLIADGLKKTMDYFRDELAKN